MKNEIRKQLWEGSSISDVCQEHNLSFKDLCDLMLKGTPKNTKKHSTGKMYICFLKDRYVIRRRNKYFGSYKNLDDAVKVRDYLILNGWYRNRLNSICEKLGVVRCGQA